MLFLVATKVALFAAEGRQGKPRENLCATLRGGMTTSRGRCLKNHVPGKETTMLQLFQKWGDFQKVEV